MAQAITIKLHGIADREDDPYFVVIQHRAGIDTSHLSDDFH